MRGPPLEEFIGVAPEIIIVVVALVLLVAGAVMRSRSTSSVLVYVAIGGLLGAGAAAVGAWDYVSDHGPRAHLSGMVAVDGFATFAKVALAVFGILTVLLSRDYLSRRRTEPEIEAGRSVLKGPMEPEFYALILFAVAGMMLIAGAADLIMVFLALETFSVALYVLVGSRRTALEGQESSMKYFLLGAFSSAFLLLGIALVYGATGTTTLYGVGEEDAVSVVSYLAGAGTADVDLLILGAGLLIVGLGFKVAAVPFHMWTPDAYQGAPSPVTGFMAAGSKLAGFIALMRVLDVVLYPLRDDWRPLVIGLAVVTMLVGSILAVVQEDFKRVLAYSSIAHAGFVLTAVIAARDAGVSAALFYLATYGVTILGAFAVVALLADEDEQRVRLVDYRGLFFRHPAMAGALTLFLLSLAGVPLTSGFVAKFLVFGAAFSAGYAWVVVVGVVASAIAAFFYLRVLVVMYMQEPDDALVETPAWSLGTGVVGLSALATLFFGLYWGPLVDLAEKATVLYA